MVFEDDGGIEEQVMLLDSMSGSELGRRIVAGFILAGSEREYMDWNEGVDSITLRLHTKNLEAYLGTIHYAQDSVFKYKGVPIQEEEFRSACSALVNTLQIIEGNNWFLGLVTGMGSSLSSYKSRHDGCFDVSEFCHLRERLRKKFPALDDINPYMPQEHPTSEECFEMIDHFMKHDTFYHPRFDDPQVKSIQKSLHNYLCCTRETGEHILLFGIEEFQQVTISLDGAGDLWVPLSTLNFAYFTGDIESEKFKDQLRAVSKE